jgi:hypothetical protein
MILHQGRLERVVLAGEGPAEGTAVTEVVYRLVLAAPHPALAQIFPQATVVEGRAAQWVIRGDLAALNHGLAQLVGAGAVVAAFAPEESRLESEFRAAVGGTE